MGGTSTANAKEEDMAQVSNIADTREQSSSDEIEESVSSKDDMVNDESSAASTENSSAGLPNLEAQEEVAVEVWKTKQNINEVNIWDEINLEGISDSSRL